MRWRWLRWRNGSTLRHREAAPGDFIPTIWNINRIERLTMDDMIKPPGERRPSRQLDTATMARVAARIEGRRIDEGIARALLAGAASWTSIDPVTGHTTEYVLPADMSEKQRADRASAVRANVETRPENWTWAAVQDALIDGVMCEQREVTAQGMTFTLPLTEREGRLPADVARAVKDAQDSLREQQAEARRARDTELRKRGRQTAHCPTCAREKREKEEANARALAKMRNFNQLYGASPGHLRRLVLHGTRTGRLTSEDNRGMMNTEEDSMTLRIERDAPPPPAFVPFSIHVGTQEERDSLVLALKDAADPRARGGHHPFHTTRGKDVAERLLTLITINEGS